MTSELHQLVDSLGGWLNRSVTIDDPDLRLLVHTAHPGEVDPARVEALLRRAFPPTLADHVHGQYVDGTDDPLRRTLPPRTRSDHLAD
ncbi:hypothetical protein [Amycolatopsis sp. NPDC051071]|uniref:hypothetical protein n=1 Tax=Amycolatopsis sp. NPDC051071 TaxID=3154637 RepID=UPI003421A297